MTQCKYFKAVRQKDVSVLAKQTSSMNCCSIMVVFASIYCVNGNVGNGSLDNIVRVWKTLGWSHVTMSSKEQTIKDKTEIMKLGSKELVKVKFLTSAPTSENHVLICEQTTPIDDIAELLNQMLPAYTILVVSMQGCPWTDVTTSQLIANRRGYYVYYHDAEPEMIYKMQTVLYGKPPVSLKIPVGTDSEAVRQNHGFDMQGNMILGITLPWPPFMSAGECKDEHRNCDLKGYATDMLDIIAGEFNFTWRVDLEPNKEWGAIPKGGGSWYDPNATFHGVLGAIGKMNNWSPFSVQSLDSCLVSKSDLFLLVDNDYDLGLPAWVRNIERLLWVDLSVSIRQSTIVLVFNLKTDSVDSTLFLRPLTQPSWLLSLAIFGIISLLFVFYNFRMKLDEDDTTFRISILAAWLLFILIQAYYSGAMTMFFTSANSLPFDTVRQGLAMWPEWKMLVHQESIIHIQPLAEAGDPYFKPHWDRIQSSEKVEEELLITDEKFGVMLSKPGYFYYGSDTKTGTMMRHYTQGETLYYIKERLHNNQQIDANLPFSKHLPTFFIQKYLRTQGT